jgi:hypothetical protein
MQIPDLFPAELPDEFYDDDHTEDPEPIERSWQEIEAEEACIPLYGPI